MKAKVKANNEIIDVHWSDDRECWHDRKKNEYYWGQSLEFLEDEIDWEQRRDFQYNHWYKVEEALPEDFFNYYPIKSLLFAWETLRPHRVLTGISLCDYVPTLGGDKQKGFDCMYQVVAWMIPKYEE